MSSNCCNGAPALIFACSGAADVGAIADQVARKLTKEGAGKMFCLAGVGGRVSGIMKTTESSEKVFVIDGCPTSCGKSCLEQAGFSEFDHLQIADLGLKKGKSPVTDDAIEKAAARGREMLNGGCGA